MRNEAGFWEDTKRWISGNVNIRSAVVFGSTARVLNEGMGIREGKSDIDIHVVSTSAKWIGNVDWNEEIGKGEFCLCASRTATGGVKRWSIIYSSSQIDMVVVPAIMMYMAKLGYRLGLHRRIRSLHVALNEMASCLRMGYVFIKGEYQWGGFYRDVSRLPGVRLVESEIVELANAAVCDCFWVLQKLERGELIAAQHVLHSRVVDTNLRLLREMRIRESLLLPSFGLGRNLESLLKPSELAAIRVSSLANVNDLETATRGALAELQRLVYRLCPSWSVSPKMTKLVSSTGPSSRHP